VVQQANRYDVALEPPLAPIDQQGLAQFLLERGARADATWEAIRGSLEELAATPLRKLLRLLAECAARFDPPTGWSPDRFLATPAEVVKALGVRLPTDRRGRTDFLDLCSRVHQALIGPTLLQSQYFRRAWLPELGPTLALAILQLRSRCFWDEHELRDETSLHFTTLAQQVGCTAQWLRLSLKTQMATQFVRVVQSGRGRRPSFKVLLREPIAPIDRGAYQEWLTRTRARPSSPGCMGAPEKKSPDRLVVSRSETLERLGVGENAAGERLELRQNGDSERLGGDENDSSEHYGSIVVLVSTEPDRLLRKKRLHDPRAETSLLLEEFGIGPPCSQRIAVESRPRDVRAWMLYALTQPRLLEVGAAQGFVVNRLLAGARPPPRSQLWAELTPREWQTLWRASHYAGRYRGAALAAAGRLREVGWSPERLLQAWQDDFGEVFPEGPFGRGRVNLKMMEEWLVEELGAPGRVDLVESGGTIVAVAGDSATYRWLIDQEKEIRSFLETRQVFHALRLLDDPGIEATSEVSASHDQVADLWCDALDALRLQMTRATFETCLSDSRLVGREVNALVIGVRNAFARDWIEARLKTVILRTVVRLARQPLEVRFVVLEREG
jgi:hypothetical protein